MLLRLYDGDIEKMIGCLEIPDTKDLPEVIRVSPVPTEPTRYFKHMSQDTYYEVTEDYMDLGNTPILPPSAYKPKPQKH